MGADIFTLIYPIFLIFLYLKGIIQKKAEDKQAALFIFFSCVISILVNILIQSFLIKNRPNVELFNADVGETVLHSFLPQSSFPSDHAVVSMSFAVATLIRGYKTKNKVLLRFGYILVLIAIIMSGCRIITVVHRPSDILGGFIVAILIPLLLGCTPLFTHLKKWLISPLIKAQEWILSLMKPKKSE
jgi:undecaprenyl-diphosphatase